MGILIGMDEAGYGPNLGPLVVAATAWDVAEEDTGTRGQGTGSAIAEATAHALLASAARPNLSRSPAPSVRRRNIPPPPDADLYRRLRRVVTRSPSERQIAIADSKQLYKPGGGLRQLERGVHAILATTQQSAESWSQAIETCGADPDGVHQGLPWDAEFNCPLPVDAKREELSRLSERLARVCVSAAVRPVTIRARLVYPAEFNELVDYYGTKGAALSHVTIGLLRKVMESLSEREAVAAEATSSHRTEPPAPNPQPPIYVVCDKHGGRNFYAGLLQHHFSEHWIEPVCESRDESRYEWGSEDQRVQVTFRTRGEAFLPTALASMAAKYLRELSMRAFNEFWCARVSGLRPTAGYPTDAPRFKRDIAALQHELRIDDHLLWRNR